MLCRSGGPRPKTTQSAAGARGLRGGPAPMVALLAMYEHVYTVTSVPRAGYVANVYYKFVAFWKINTMYPSELTLGRRCSSASSWSGNVELYKRQMEREINKCSALCSCCCWDHSSCELLTTLRGLFWNKRTVDCFMAVLNISTLPLKDYYRLILPVIQR